eukprot:5338476-Pyramimonas_sp.AAC.1
MENNHMIFAIPSQTRILISPRGAFMLICHAPSARLHAGHMPASPFARVLKSFQDQWFAK